MRSIFWQRFSKVLKTAQLVDEEELKQRINQLTSGLKELIHRECMETLVDQLVMKLPTLLPGGNPALLLRVRCKCFDSSVSGHITPAYLLLFTLRLFLEWSENAPIAGTVDQSNLFFSPVLHPCGATPIHQLFIGWNDLKPTSECTAAEVVVTVGELSVIGRKTTSNSSTAEQGNRITLFSSRIYKAAHGIVL